MSPMTDACAHRTHSDTVDHLASVAMVPMLVHELVLRYCERAQLVLEHRVFVLWDDTICYS